jgi:hypothetical protein
MGINFDQQILMFDIAYSNDRFSFIFDLWSTIM